MVAVAFVTRSSIFPIVFRSSTWVKWATTNRPIPRSYNTKVNNSEGIPSRRLNVIRNSPYDGNGMEDKESHLNCFVGLFLVMMVVVTPELILLPHPFLVSFLVFRFDKRNFQELVFLLTCIMWERKPKAETCPSVPCFHWNFCMV